jgi:hypothetical protein
MSKDQKSLNEFNKIQQSYEEALKQFKQLIQDEYDKTPHAQAIFPDKCQKASEKLLECIRSTMLCAKQLARDFHLFSHDPTFVKSYHLKKDYLERMQEDLVNAVKVLQNAIVEAKRYQLDLEATDMQIRKLFGKIADTQQMMALAVQLELKNQGMKPNLRLVETPAQNIEIEINQRKHS